MLLFLVMGVILFGSAIYFVEEQSSCPISDPGCSNSFVSIPHSMWWAIITLTTVGYGDEVPVTGLGKLVASLCVVVGVIMLGGPISVMSSTFGEKYAETQKMQLLLKQRERQKKQDQSLAQARGKLAFAEQLGNMLARTATGDPVEAFDELVQRVFVNYDLDRSGTIDASEVVRAMRALGLNMDEETALAWMMDTDANQDGGMDIIEFGVFAAKAALDVEGLPDTVVVVLKERVEDFHEAHPEKKQKSRGFLKTQSSKSMLTGNKVAPIPKINKRTQSTKFLQTA
eukprot:CAMPEP_0184291928 /NCGR_PEP_ID=MMETSP1049-20130417/3799_1 /TAXON_ID=77928 /ORGANISM="Proteomonas sulcata, Strain CCMP704" /LENGTH=284 /DNA_ID=CAMNT_0026599507 /DNA_START=27 /DNA_END=877 /DNA_ORIENTATION=-